MTNSSDGLSWGVDTPVSASPRKDGAAEILGIRKGIALRYDKEHVAAAVVSAGPDLATGGGEHKKGSAVAYFEDGAPALTRPDADSTAFTAADSGRLAVDTTGSAYVLKVYDHDAAAFANVSGTQQASGSLTVSSLVAGVVTLTVGFIPDVMYCMYGTAAALASFIAMPADLDPHEIREFTAVNSQDWLFTVNGTDIDLSRVSGTITPTGTFYWRAVKF